MLSVCLCLCTLYSVLWSLSVSFQRKVWDAVLLAEQLTVHQEKVPVNVATEIEARLSEAC